MGSDFRPYRGFAEIKLVREGDLYNGSHTGWELLAAKEEREVVTEYDSNSGRNIGVGVDQKVVLVMGRPEQSTILTLQQQVDNVNGKLAEMAKQEVASKKERESLRKKIEELEHALEREKKSVESRIEEKTEKLNKTLCDKLEKIGELADMVEFANAVTERLKLWVGEKAWNEVTWLVEEDRDKMRRNAERAGNMAKEAGVAP